MLTFIISLIALVLGYVFYGRFVERVFRPDDRPCPATTQADGVDYLVLPRWKIFMIQFLNIAGTGPIFGAIMGAKFGPSCYLWIVFGCIFAGAVHDYLSGMLSMRSDGAGLPEIIGRQLGSVARTAALVFTVALLILVGAVFVYSPAVIMSDIWGSSVFWIAAIFIYYIVATLLPIDKVIGKVYPLFAFALLFMALGLMVVLFVRMPQLPELWDGLGNMAKTVSPTWTDNIFPCLFITVACGAISGFHATQSPMMARCMESERMGRGIFYGSMITEGVVALVWATVSMWFFYDAPEPGYTTIAAAKLGFGTPAPSVVALVCSDWLGVVGGVLALLGVVAAPITTGDTAFRSARLIVSEAIGLHQQSVFRRLYVSIPLFGAAFAMLMWQIGNPDGFNTVWQYFGWANQSLAVFTLWALTVYLARKGKPYWLTLIPAIFMTDVCTSYIFVSSQAIGIEGMAGYYIGLAITALITICFFVWKQRSPADKD